MMSKSISEFTLQIRFSGVSAAQIYSYVKYDFFFVVTGNK